MIQNIEDKEKSGIYVIENKINGKVYVGKAINIYRRIKNHVTSLNTKNKNENRHLINSWHKYGRNNFTYYVSEYIEYVTREEIDLLLKNAELFWINKLNCLDPEKGYNMRCDSEGGMIVSEETKKQMSISQTKRYKNPEERAAQSETMKKLHKEHPEIYVNSKDKIAYKRRKFRIAKCDKNTGEIIKIYDIINHIINEHSDFYKQAIKGCCQGTKNSYRGFRWHYVKLDSDELVLKGKFLK